MLDSVIQRIVCTDDVCRDRADGVAGIRHRVDVAGKMDDVIDPAEVAFQRRVYVIRDKLKVFAVNAVRKP